LFVQTALYVATPQLLVLVKQTVADCPKPSDLFDHIGIHYGLRVKGRAGVTRAAQIEALVPYLNRISQLDLYEFWQDCNHRGWLDLRRRYFDELLNEQFRCGVFEDDRIAALFDKAVLDDRPYFLDARIDDILKSGVTTERLMMVLQKWLSSQMTMRALRLVTIAVVHVGRRKYLENLDVPVSPREFTDGLVADTRFAVRCRSLS
jgi:hypothetical protein